MKLCLKDSEQSQMSAALVVICGPALPGAVAHAGQLSEAVGAAFSWREKKGRVEACCL